MSFRPRPQFDWQLRTRSLTLGQRTLIMGILNVTPDSFSDGGHFYNEATAPERALEQAVTMLDRGANLIDIGGESTRPGATPLTPDEEQARVLPVIEALLHERPTTILSIDTFHAATARRVVEAGAEIVNDVSGGLWDDDMLSTCTSLKCGLVLMHTRGRPDQWKSLPPLATDKIVPTVAHELKARIAAAHATGIASHRIVIDPGIGFGKRLDENFTLLAHLDALQHLRLPVLVGVSRKSFLAHTLAQAPNLAAVHQGVPPPVNARLDATTAANVAAILTGAHILRVHDIQPAAEAAAIADHVLMASSQ
ncbi:dihydropteroate synthase [Edaphobacter flagellatus]|uniref:dihydropteroate synthase n=1 Tax=Edaphobacter flagellatus TaxID=1933044 RepID=UPI0021B1CB06|nr:dihydropteroate synthase [Edaphobacter flagellatus]